MAEIWKWEKLSDGVGDGNGTIIRYDQLWHVVIQRIADKKDRPKRLERSRLAEERPRLLHA